jgi:hypothetical protein
MPASRLMKFPGIFVAMVYDSPGLNGSKNRNEHNEKNREIPERPRYR